MELWQVVNAPATSLHTRIDYITIVSDKSSISNVDVVYIDNSSQHDLMCCYISIEACKFTSFLKTLNTFDFRQFDQNLFLSDLEKTNLDRIFQIDIKVNTKSHDIAHS